MLILEALLLTACVVLARRQSVSRALAGYALLALAALSGLSGVILKSSGDGLAQVELPAYFQTTTIILADDRRIAFLRSLHRVQRYSADGSFEGGWFITGDAGMLAGAHSLGLTADDKIIIASDRLKQAEIYTVEGRLVAEKRPVQRVGAGAPKVILPDSFLIDGVALVVPVRTDNPRLGWTTVLPSVSLHSWTAWALFWLGLNMLRPTKPQTPTVAAIAPPFKRPSRLYDDPPDREIQVSAWAMSGNLASMFALIVLAVLVFIVVVAVPTVRLLAAS